LVARNNIVIPWLEVRLEKAQWQSSNRQSKPKKEKVYPGSEPSPLGQKAIQQPIAPTPQLLKKAKSSNTIFFSLSRFSKQLFHQAGLSVNVIKINWINIIPRIRRLRQNRFLKEVPEATTTNLSWNFRKRLLC